MTVSGSWCTWFYTPVCGYKFHALIVYLLSTFTVPPIGSTFRIQSNICGGGFFPETVNVLRPLWLFSQKSSIVKKSCFDRMFDSILYANLPNNLL